MIEFYGTANTVNLTEFPHIICNILQPLGNVHSDRDMIRAIDLSETILISVSNSQGDPFYGSIKILV